jgi:drug/metabolite transporter (DMT)-like permease
MSRTSLPTDPLRTDRLKADRLRADLLLLLTAVIWGLAFVAQRISAGQIGVYFFNAARFVIGAAVLWLITSLALRQPVSLRLNRQELAAAVTAGIVLFLGTALQQAGLQYTTAGNAGFITGLYVVIVPFLLAGVLRRPVSRWVWLAAGVAVLGLLLLSTGATLGINRGDLLELAGAFAWAVHVLVVGWAMRWMSVLRFSIVQFLLAAGLHLAFGLLFETPVAPWPAAAWLPVLYVGIFSTGIGYTLQAAGQRHAPETDAAFLLNLESVFAALGGYLLLGETLTLVQLVGCGLLLAAVLLAQLRPGAQPVSEPPRPAG